jgi:hypothetical protein
VVLAFPALAVAGEREVPRQGALPTGASVDAVKDTVLTGRGVPRMRAARVGARAARMYAAQDGQRVEVEVSHSYATDPAADQALVDFLGSRLHGSELGSLRVYVGTPSEIETLCGGAAGVIACYAIDEGRMYVPGESVEGIPVEYPLTHEYGHHIASWRSNDPWDALDWGPKYWSSATSVCENVRSRLLFPGDQGSHYLDDPGEGFADGYAHLQYPDAPWYYNELMRPNAAAFAAIRRDVLHPWTRPRSRTFRGRLGPGHGRRSFHIRVHLDGDLALRLAAPRGTVYEVSAETPGFAAGHRLRGSGSFGIEWCRQRSQDAVELTVRRRAGAGRFALRVSWPG